MSYNIFTKAYFDGKTSNYFLGYDSLLFRLGHYIRAKAIISFVSKYKKSGKLLDVGCAFGILSNYFSKAGFGVTGIDVSSYAIRKAKSKFPQITFLKGDVQKKTKFENNEFDIVIALEVLEHCKNLTNILKEMKRVLKKDGIVLISVPTTDINKKSLYSDKSHIWFLSSKVWLDLLKRNGFKVVKKVIFLKKLKKINSEWCSNFILIKKSI